MNVPFIEKLGTGKSMTDQTFLCLNEPPSQRELGGDVVTRADSVSAIKSQYLTNIFSLKFYRFHIFFDPDLQLSCEINFHGLH